MAVSTANSVARAVLTLHASVSFVHEQWALFPLNLAPIGGEHPTRRWFSSTELASMRCPLY